MSITSWSTPSRRMVLSGALAAGVSVAGGSSARARPDDAPAMHRRTHLEGRPLSVLAAMLGVCVKTDMGRDPYGQHDRILDALIEGGISWIRTRFGGSAAQLEWLSRLADHGVRTCAIMGHPGHRSGPETLVQAAERIPHAILALEGANEWNLRGGHDWAEELRTHQDRLVEAARSSAPLQNAQVVAPSLGMRKGFEDLGRVPCDRGNIHLYTGGFPPGHRVDDYLTELSHVSGEAPAWVTETGWHNATRSHTTHYPTPQDVAGIYAPRLLLEYFRRGVTKLAIYGLVNDRPDPDLDDREANFGLLESDWRPKPAFTALANFNAILAQPAERPRPAARSLNVEFLERPDDLQTQLVTDDDGRQILCLWRTVSIFDPVRQQRLDVPNARAVLRWGESRAVRQYAPSRSRAALDVEHTMMTTLTLGADVQMLILT